MASLLDVDTPALVVDRGIVAANCRRMLAHAAAHHVAVRPHLKTAKSAAVARLAVGGADGPITVSTVAEARYFAERGFRDILYAVGASETKLAALAPLVRAGTRILLTTDSSDMALRLAAAADAEETKFEVLIELDTGAGRAGVPPEGDALTRAAAAVASSRRLSVAGVMTHAGHSYTAASPEDIRRIAEAERAGAVLAASRLRADGHACPIVSIGSTPSILFGESFASVTEIRPGVYTLFDLDQHLHGCCGLTDIAASVLATVTSHNLQRGHAIIDAGGLALSKDRSACSRDPHAGYGWLVDAATGRRLDGLFVADLYQEHGVVRSHDGSSVPARLPVGSRVRVLPSHVCMTAASYGRYLVTDGGADVVDEWDKATGWS